MPFQSEKQRRFLHANHPEIAKRWERDYANGGISNHFRKRFFKGAQADTQGPAGGQAMSPGTSTTGGTRHGGGGGNSVTGGGEPPIILNPPKGPTAAELAAREEARLQALEDARRQQVYDDVMSRRKKNIEYYDENLKTEFDITPIAKGVDTAADLYRTYEAIKGLKDLNPYGWLAGQVLKKVTGYRDGGILDINASEEIISDDGNDIELTDYNAAFDEPTGVKTLFQAKDGGRIGYAQGWSPGVAAEERAAEKSSGGGDGGYQDRIIEVQERTRKQDLKDLVETGPGSPIEKYDTQAQHLADLPGKLEDNSYKSRVNVDYKNDNYERALANQKAKLKSMGLGKLMPLFLMIAFGVPPMDALKAFPKTISITQDDLRSLITHGLPVMKAKKELIEALEIHKGGLLKDVDITNPNEMVNLEETTDFIETRDQLTKLTTTPEDDDTKGDGPQVPQVPQVVSIGGESEQYAQPGFDYWGFIKDKQAQKKAYDVKMAQENLMLQQPGLAYGQQFFNKGGLANLFRVKNQ